MVKLSVVISAFNEEKKIKDCLVSVDFADEIILVDNSSTDKTAAIAKSLGAKIYTRENNPMLNTNKNFGFTKAENEWILSLDADERVTGELKKEIIDVLGKDTNDVSAFSMPRKNIIFGKWIEHTGWYPDFQIRLFRRSKAKFPALHVHEQIKVEGEVHKLRSPIYHESYKTITEFLTKFFTIYAPNEAEVLLKDKNYNFSTADFLKKPFSEFINRFYYHKGYKDGVHGLTLSLLMAFYHLTVVAFVWEKKGFTPEEDDSRQVVNSALPSLQKELKYWDLQSKSEDASLPKSVFYRLIRKISV